jgi:hypothetical protein
MNSSQTFHNTWALQQLPVTMQLLNIEWRFLICCDGKTNIGQIQARLGITESERDTMVRRLSTIGLITESSMSLDDFARSTVDRAHPNNGQQTFQEYVAAAESPLNSNSTTPSKEKNIPAFSHLQKTTQPTPSMSLQAVIQFILNHSNSDPTAGHFATYQVFMGIGTALLKRNGITSLRFQDDRIITDPELQNAIVESVQKVLKVKCTPEMLSAPVAAQN